MTAPPNETDAPNGTAAYEGERVQCPNCCQLAPITGRVMGLLLYRCELCGSTGAATPGDLVSRFDTLQR